MLGGRIRSGMNPALYIHYATGQTQVRSQHDIDNLEMSVQATIGFGARTVGVCISSAIVLTIQNVTGMILDAVSLGIIFAKLSHPKHRGRSVLISETATIAHRDGQLKFMFRIADCRCGSLSPCCTHIPQA
jgi:Inward rectifier potassium channel transmembrane domain